MNKLNQSYFEEKLKASGLQLPIVNIQHQSLQNNIVVQL